MSMDKYKVVFPVMLLTKLPKGEVIIECSIQTSDGVKVADVAWLSSKFIGKYAYTTPYPKAPEIVSPSNSKEEMNQKIDLYLAEGALDVWIAYDLNNIDIYTHEGQVKQSDIV